jgi:PIN domain nuclease of toxin-antitoxin system
MAIVADTHAIIWYLVEPERLSQVALDALEGAIAAGEPVYISAISLIEICYLIEKRRIASDLLQRILAVLNEPDPSLIVVPIDLAISIAVQNIVGVASPWRIAIPFPICQIELLPQPLYI